MGTIRETEQLFVGGTIREIYIVREELVNNVPLIFYREKLRNGKLGAMVYSTAKSDLIAPQLSRKT